MTLTKLDPLFGNFMRIAFEKSKERRGIFVLAKVEKQIAASIERSLSLHDPRYVSALADEIKRETEEQFFQAYRKRGFVDPSTSRHFVKTVVMVCPEAAYPLSTVWSGYARETSVSSVKTIPNGFALALLILRLNDWVPQVRNAAENKLAELKDKITDEAIMECAELLLDFDRYGRTHQKGRDIILTLIQRASFQEKLIDFISNSKEDIAARYLTLCLRHEGYDRYLISLSKSALSWRVRFIATKALIQNQFAWRQNRELMKRHVNIDHDADALMRQALSDQSPKVNAFALDYIIKNIQSWPDAEVIFRRFVPVRAISVAEKAIFGLKSLGIDVPALIRSSLWEAGRPNPNIANLLARYGDQSDIPQLLEIASNLSSRQSVPYLGVAAELSSEESIRELVKIALSDNDLYAARSASAALLKSGNRMDDKTLMQRSIDAQDFISRGFLKHMRKMSVVPGLTVLCRLERQEIDIDTKAWLDAFHRKLNRSYFAPKNMEVLLLKVELRQSVHMQETIKRRFGFSV